MSILLSKIPVIHLCQQIYELLIAILNVKIIYNSNDNIDIFINVNLHGGDIIDFYLKANK